MIVCVPVAGDGQVDPRWGRANRVALANVQHGAVVDWQEHAVGWGNLHDAGSEGSHHARVARFLQEHRVEGVIAHHMGQGMHHMLQKMGVRVHLGAAGDARAAVIAAAG
jgi:predicted Fe-Mo cluster-binding NifX family protein